MKERMLMASMKSEKGFSLIELMIVVAIIGILATMAVPNFSRMQARAKQSEAKANLSAIYTAEKAFYAEWSTYYSSMADIGYVPEGKMNYGVATASGASAPIGGNFVAATGPGAGCNDTTTCGSLNIQKTASVMAASGASAAANTAGFTAGAVGNLMGGAVADIWTMDNNRSLKNNQPGI